MNEKENKSYIYITPFLDEVERIKNQTNINIYAPKHKGKGKLDDFNNLIGGGENIVSTHALFSKINDETRDLIKQGHYTLILDEVLDVVSPFTELKKDDIKLLFDNNFVTVDADRYVVWNDNKTYDAYRYTDVQTYAKNKSLIYVDNTMLLWQFPEETFKLFDEVYIMTYMFHGQIMKNYYDYYNIQYTYKSVCNDEGRYYLSEYVPQDENRQRFKERINIYQ